jgi:nucleoside-diphosphate-sugar epimerase
MSVLVTGAAGFIGSHVARALLARGEAVVGVDNFSNYYDPVLKFARLKPLRDDKSFIFLEADIADHDAMLALAEQHRDLDRIVHLAAQPGVRHSLVDPYIYVRTNVMGQLVMLELAKRLPGLKHFVYASSSSVYGANRKLPFATADRVDQPMSLYAATKRADELLGETYAHLFGLKVTGLRYFTVYGPWGRPDMSPYIFAKAILRAVRSSSPSGLREARLQHRRHRGRTLRARQTRRGGRPSAPNLGAARARTSDGDRAVREGARPQGRIDSSRRSLRHAGDRRRSRLRDLAGSPKSRWKRASRCL